jgi:hypothetical protein
MNPLLLHGIAKQASETFIRSGLAASLDGAIAKLATQHGLSPVQIQRVVEIANHDVNDRVRNDAVDKTYTFKLASVDGVLGELNPVAKPTVPITDVLSAIEHLGKTASYTDTLPAKIASVTSKLTDEAATTAKLTKIAFHKLSSRLSLLSRELEAERLGKLAKLANDLDELFQATKNYVLIDKIPLSDLRKYACESDPARTPLWNLVFAEIRKDLEKLGHPYTGILASDKELSSDYKGRTAGRLEGSKVTVVNGDHALAIQMAPIVITVPEAEWLRDKRREIDNFFSSVRLVEDSVDNNEQVDKYLQKTAEALYELSTDRTAFLEELSKHAIADKAKAAASIAVGEAGVRYGNAVMKAVATKGIHNWVPARFPAQGGAQHYLHAPSN